MRSCNPPLAQSTTINNGSFDNIKSGSTAVSYGPNGLTATGNPTFKVPDYANYNLSVQHQLTAQHGAGSGLRRRRRPAICSALSMRISLQSRAAEAAPTTQTNALRPFLGYAGITERGPIFTNNYNSLQVSLNHHSRGLQVGVAYTYSKDLTTQSTTRNALSTYQYDFKLDYGPSNYNQPQSFVANYVYDLPFFNGQQGFMGRVAGGWEVSGITSFLSGQSFNLSQPFDPWDPTGIHVGTGSSGTRPDQVAAVHMSKNVASWFTTNSFAPAIGHWGSEGSGSIARPRIRQLGPGGNQKHQDRRAVTFQLRGEFFNAFNHESFASVDSSLSDSSFYGGSGFGQVTSATHRAGFRLARSSSSDLDGIAVLQRAGALRPARLRWSDPLN